MARTTIAAVLGLIASSRSLFGPAPIEALRDGLRALMSMPLPKTHTQSDTQPDTQPDPQPDPRSDTGTDNSSVNLIETQSN